MLSSCKFILGIGRNRAIARAATAAPEQMAEGATTPTPSSAFARAAALATVIIAALVAAMFLLAAGSDVTAAHAQTSEPRSAEFTVSFDAAGGQGVMPDEHFTIIEGGAVSAALPPNVFVREGYVFAGWRTEVPSFCHLNPVVVPDEQQFQNLAWEDARAIAQQDGWSGPMTLHSFASEDGLIKLQAIWVPYDDAFGASDSNGDNDGEGAAAEEGAGENVASSAAAGEGADADAASGANTAAAATADTATSTSATSAAAEGPQPDAEELLESAYSLLLPKDSRSFSTQTSSTTYYSLYHFKKGYQAYLSINGSAPSGFSSSYVMAYVPKSSATPIYCLNNPYNTTLWYWTYSASEYNSLASAGWTQKGIGFYSDDAHGVAINKFYRSSGGYHDYSTGSSVSGMTFEETIAYGLKWYNVNYYGGGADSGSTAAQRMQYGITYYLQSCGFTKAGYHFTGWYCSNGSVYPAGKAVANLSATAEGSVSMTALWARDYFYQDYSANDGDGCMAQTSVVNGASFSVPQPAFTRKGYIFAGWNTAQDGSGASYKPGDAFVPSDDMTLYAQWDPLQLSFSVPDSIELLLHANGTIDQAPGQAYEIGNESAAQIAVSGLKIVAADGAFISSGEPASGQLRLQLTRDGAQDIELGDYAGPDFAEVPDGTFAPIAGKTSVSLGKLVGYCNDGGPFLAPSRTIGDIGVRLALRDVQLTYWANDGTDVSYVQCANAGLCAVASACMFTYDEHSFAGWNTQPDGTGAWIAPGDELEFVEDRMLYAQWGY